MSDVEELPAFEALEEADVKASQYLGATVSVTALIPFIRLLADYDAEKVSAATDGFERYLERWGVSITELDDPSARLPHGLMAQLITFFTGILGDTSAPVLAATKLQRGDYELIEYLCATTPTLGEAVQCLANYYPLLISADIQMVNRGDLAELRFRIAPGLEAPDAFNEYAHVSNYLMCIMHIKLNENIKPLAGVKFAHPAPPHAALFRELFQCPVEFECEHNALLFEGSMLDQPMADADPVLHGVLARLADQELRAMFESSAFPAKVREAIEATLTQGAALDDVARRLRMSPNTLRSRLRQYGITYSTLLDQLRREYAKRALRQSRASVAEVSHQLGFAHPPAFNRAFKRWFGVAPSAYRLGQGASLTDRLLRYSDRPGSGS